MAAWVTGQRAGWPHTSGSHMRQMTRLAVESVVSAPSMRSSMGVSARRSAASRASSAASMASARAASAASAARAARRREAQGDGAPVAVAAVSLDQPARLQAVGQTHDAGVREGERAAQQVQRLALGVVAQGHERGGVAARDAGVGLHGRGRAVGQRQREGSQEIAGALVRGHGVSSVIASAPRGTSNRASWWACGRRSR